VLIGVDASRVTRVRTGTENYSLQVLRELLRLDQTNTYRLYLAQALPPGLLPLSARTSTRLIRLPRLWTQAGLSTEMLRRAPDLLFVPSHVLPLALPRRSVVVIYDVGHRVVPDAHGLLERLYLEWSIRRHVRVASRLLTISAASKRDLVAFYGADPDRIGIAYPAAGPRFRPASEPGIAAVRARYGLTDDYVLHLGTIKPRKNLPRLIRAFAEADLPPRTQLVLGGMTTTGAAGVERAIAAAGVADRVRRLAYVPDADLPALYSGAQSVAIVSLYEGFGMPALEALACGAAVVASTGGSLPEIVADVGTLVDPWSVASIAQGLERARTDVAAREAGPRRAAEFSWPAAAQVTLATLLEAGGLASAAPAPGAPRSAPS
jgi:glycosyltransferase involved in cell wall biosynthesis